MKDSQSPPSPRPRSSSRTTRGPPLLTWEAQATAAGLLRLSWRPGLRAPLTRSTSVRESNRGPERSGVMSIGTSLAMRNASGLTGA
eukprot:3593759-Alexandrium_andersonii.AAC.1